MSPISELRQLASGAETGEFVCAGQTAEVHVHLQSGRVAWATSSAARVGLAQLLQDFCALDGKALGEDFDAHFGTYTGINGKFVLDGKRVRLAPERG